MTEVTGTELLAQLRRYKPQSIKALCRDGTDRAVAVPKSGNRWQRCMQTLDALDWEKLECLDKEGRVLGVIEAAEDQALLEELAEGGGGDVHALARIMLEVMRTTQKETRQMFEVQMRGQAELVQALIEGVRSVSDSYSLAMKVQASAAAVGGNEGDPEMANMLKMAMALAMQPKPTQLPKPAGAP